MPVAVEEDVAVVAVLNLEEVRHEGVAGQRFREVALCSDELS